MAKLTELDLNRRVALDDLNRRYKRVLQSRPVVDTGLGYAIQGGYQDIQNLEGAKAIGAPQVRDADNVMRDVAANEWDVILTAIRMHASQRFSRKWQVEDAIKSASTLSELRAIDTSL